ncbi:MAG: CotH kinase family protein, partial [SAR324 cluster bacterium]|nr:CotH kinase family protein [SAR324 cluster bacterium]
MTIIDQIKLKKGKLFPFHLYGTILLIAYAAKCKIEFVNEIVLSAGKSYLAPWLLGSIFFYIYYKLIKKINLAWVNYEEGLFLNKIGWYHGIFYILIFFPLDLTSVKYGHLNNLLEKLSLIFAILLLVEISVHWFVSGKVQHGMPLKKDERLFNPLKFVPAIPLVKLFLFIVFTFGLYHMWIGSSALVKDYKIKNALQEAGEKSSFGKIETLNIKIRPSSFLKIQKVVTKYKRRHILREKVFHPAVIEQNGETIPIKIRLKGDWTDHISTDKKWSFRIAIKGEHSFMGMKTFSIQHPQTRSWVKEWILIKHLQNIGILAPHYKFITVNINGESWGVYALEEGFTKQLLESQNRREGVIVKFNEDALWSEGYRSILSEEESGTKLNLPLYLGRGDHIDEVIAFGSGGIQKDQTANDYFSAAAQKLDAFRRRKATVKETFDIEKMAQYSALVDLFSAYHGIQHHNRRFYYNPVTSLLEPIHFDGGIKPSVYGPIYAPFWGLRSLKNKKHSFTETMNSFMFEDPYFVERYLYYAMQVSDPSYLEKVKETIDPELQVQLKLIQSEWPKQNFRWKFFEDIATAMRAGWLDYKSEKATLLVFSQNEFFQAKEKTVRLELANIQLFPVQIAGLEYRHKKRVVPLEILNDGGLLQVNPKTGLVYIPGNIQKQEFHQVKARVPDFLVKELGNKFDVAKIRVSFRSIHLDKVTQKMVTKRSRFPQVGPPTRNFNMSKSLKAHPFLTKQGRVVTIQQGTWRIKGDLVIPEGYRVKAISGTKLEFEEKAIFLSYSPVSLIGSSTKPVIFTAQGDKWSGFLVSQAEGKSVLQNVIFEKAEWIKRKTWSSPGGITFYESDVDILDSEFKHGKGEDGLNIVRSKFFISNSLFEDFPSDAFDGDFSVGT